MAVENDDSLLRAGYVQKLKIFIIYASKQIADAERKNAKWMCVILQFI